MSAIALDIVVGRTFASGAKLMARMPSESFFSLSAPAFSNASAASPCPSEMATIYQQLSVMGLLDEP